MKWIAFALLTSALVLGCAGGRTSCERDGFPMARPTRTVPPTHDAMPRVARTGQSHAWDLPPSMPWTVVDDESGDAYWLLAHATSIEGLADNPGFVGFSIVLIGR